MITGNGNKCECNAHEGRGYFPDGSALTAADTAARYQRLRDHLPHYFTPEMQGYLQSYEAAHGEVSYQMQERGKGSGEFVPKGVPVLCPVAGGQQYGQKQRQGYNWQN